MPLSLNLPNYIFIFITENQIAEFDTKPGLYKLLDEGESKQENPIISNDINSDILNCQKRIFLFTDKGNRICQFYDEVAYLSHKIIPDTSPIAILFTFKSLLRHVEA